MLSNCPGHLNPTSQIDGGESPDQASKPRLQNSDRSDGEAPVLNFKGNSVFELSISGTPGSRGWLTISTTAERKNPEIEVLVAFQLAPCLWGFEGQTVFTGLAKKKVTLGHCQAPGCLVRNSANCVIERTADKLPVLPSLNVPETSCLRINWIIKPFTVQNEKEATAAIDPTAAKPGQPDCLNVSGSHHSATDIEVWLGTAVVGSIPAIASFSF